MSGWYLLFGEHYVAVLYKAVSKNLAHKLH